MNPKHMAILLLLLTSCQDRSTEPNTMLHDGEWAVYNNMWGATTRPARISFDDYSQTVFRNVGGNRFMWRWSIESDVDNVKGAPQAFTGQNPYVESARAGTTLPIQLSKIDRLYVTYDLSMVELPGVESSHNVIWHIWITDGSPNGRWVETSDSSAKWVFLGETNIVAELAVVLDRTCTEIHPVVDTTQTWDMVTMRVTIGDYDGPASKAKLTNYYVRAWTQPVRGFPVIYFERETPLYSGTLCLSDLLWYATTKGYITRNDHLACVALMTEVRYGAGGIMVKKLEMEVRHP